MVDRHGNAVLTDMGLCVKFRESQFPKTIGGYSSSGHRLKQRKSLDIVGTEKLKCVGTYGFRAPELLAAEKGKDGYSIEVDYWALGVTIYYLLEGKTPFKSRAPSILAQSKSPKDQERRLHEQTRKYPSDFDPIVASVVDGLLEKDPTKRLGHNSDDLRNHQFFKSIDWEALDKRKLKSPYKPKVKNYPKDEKPQFDGLAAAMAQFTANDNVLEMFGGENDLESEYSHVGRKDQKLFRNWGYIPDSNLIKEWNDLDN